jgi:hypothetical protein
MMDGAPRKTRRYINGKFQLWFHPAAELRYATMTAQCHQIVVEIVTIWKLI